MIKDEIIALKKNAKKPCVTITFPIDRSFGNSAQNELQLKKFVNEADDLLVAFNDASAAKNVAKLLHEAKINLEATNHPDGVAIFACPDYIKTIYLPYQPAGQVQVDNTFDIREVLYLLGQSIVYFSLCLGREGARLFTCSQDIVHEVENEFFPAKYSDDFQHEQPQSIHRGTSSLGSGKEKSDIIDERLTSFFRQVDKHLSVYLKKNVPIVILGIQDLTSKFITEMHHKDHLAGVIHGSYLHVDKSEIGKQTSHLIRAWQIVHEGDIFLEIDNAINSHLFTSGLDNVVRAVEEGNCNVLIVEKSYNDKIESDGRLSTLKGSDAINQLIELAMEKDCKVEVVNDDTLALFQHIGLILRYTE